jgi:CheY-like chemotaxis protein
VEFDNGKDAFDKLRQMNLLKEKMPDIILLDLNMPIWDGWDFLNEFLKLKLAVPPDVYIITSSANPEEREKGLSYHMVKGFLVKPIDLDSLRTIFLS